MEDELPFDDTAVLVLSEGVGQTRTRTRRAVTADEWPPEPPRPAVTTPAPRHARFYPVVRRPTTCSDDAM
jgi:hypothetical protein